MARRTSYASSSTPTLSLYLHTIQNLHSSKALFLLFFLFRKVLMGTRSCCKSVLQAPLYKLMTIPAHGHLSTRLIQTSISKSMPFFRISSLTFPFCTQEPLNVDGMKVFACPSAKQPFWSFTLFLKLLPLFLVDTSVAKLFVSRWRLVHQYCTSSSTRPSSALPSTRMHSLSLWSPVVQVKALILPLHSQSLPNRQSVEQDFLEKSTAPFSKKSSSDMNKQPTNPTDFNEKTVKRHSPDTLTRAAKQTWSHSAHSNRPTMGTNVPVKFPLLGRTSFIKCPTSAPPPTPPPAG